MCGSHANLGLLGSVSVVFKGFTIRHPVYTESRLMIELGRIVMTEKRIDIATSSTEVYADYTYYFATSFLILQ